METENHLRKELPILIMVFLPMLFILIVKNQLNSLAQINWIEPKQISIWIFLSSLMGLNILIYGLMLFIQRIDPKKSNYEIFISKFYKIRFIISLFMSVIIGLFIASNSGI
jgi:hypothetical protein